MRVPPPLPRRDAARPTEPDPILAELSPDLDDTEPATPRVSAIRDILEPRDALPSAPLRAPRSGLVASVIVVSLAAICALEIRARESKLVALLEALPPLPSAVIEGGLRSAPRASPVSGSREAAQPLELPPARRQQPSAPSASRR